MKNSVKKWLYGISSAFIGGGASAVTSGITAMGFAPDKFNLTDVNGAMRLLGLVFVNFIVSGIFSMFFYLRQSPLPPESFDSNPQAFRKNVERAVAVEKVQEGVRADAIEDSESK